MNALWWWIDRWRKSTAYTDLTLREQGAYRNLLDEATLRGGRLPNDHRILAKACGDPRVWPQIRGKLLSRFLLDSCTNSYHHETLDSVLHQSARRARNQQRYREKRRSGGANGPANAAAHAPDNQAAYPDPDLSYKGGGVPVDYIPAPVEASVKPRTPLRGGTTCPHHPRCRSTRACIARVLADSRQARR